MKIFKIDYGFETIINNGCISKIISHYSDTDHDNNISILYEDGRTHSISIPVEPFNSQYGLPVSNDNKLIYASSWEKGLMAYDIESGDLVWRYKASRICDIAVYDGFIIVKKDSYAIIKLDEKTGEFISEIKSGTIIKYMPLNDKYALVENIRGKLSVVDLISMEVACSYSEKTVYPNGTIGYNILSAYLYRKELHITGLCSRCPGRFDIMIDNDMNLE